MGTDKGSITKPQLPPKPQLRGGRWHASTNVIQKKDTEGEASHQLLNRHSTEKGLDSLPQSKPIPKPRRHRPSPRLDPLSRSANSDSRNVSSEVFLPTSDTTASVDNSPEADTVASACPLSCPCVCHHASKHGPVHGLHEIYQPDTSVYTDREYHNPQLESWNIIQQEKPRRVPPNIPVPERPLPKKPLQILTADEKETTGHEIKEGVYVDIDRQSHSVYCNFTPALSHSPLGNGCVHTYSEDILPPTKPVPPLRTRYKEKIPGERQSKQLDTDCVILDSLKNELCRILSGENQESGGDIQKPRAIKDAFFKFILSKSKAQPASEQKKTQLCLVPSQNKTHTRGDTAEVITAEEPTGKARQKESPVEDKTQAVMKHKIRHFSSTKSIQTLAKSHAPSSGMLPSRALGVQDKCKDNTSHGGLLERLWQERSVVKDSGIQFTKEDILLQESIYEVAITEQSYLDGLTVAVDHFQECPELKLAIAPRDQKSLFSGISKIREISQSFMDAMVQKLEASLLCDAICDVVHHYATGPFDAYVDYIRNMPYQKQTLANLRTESRQVVEILCKLQDDPCCNRLPLDSFLSLPFQRIPRLKILMETVLKRTAPESHVHASAERALREISKVVEACNREVGKMKQMEELLRIANKIEFECKALPLVSSSRRLVKEGHLAQLSLKENIFGKKELCPAHLFLFNDLLLVATKKKSDRYVVHDHVHRSLIEVIEGAKLDEDLDGCNLSTVFQLALVKNHKGTMCHYLLQAPTQEQRDSWLDVLSNQKGEEEEEEERVYEEWDCPQVRCIEVYHAQQPGELSLQREDIVNIIQKTSDGYMEGQRLRDGERGRFPAVCVEEISTEHVQRRHLRERYRVLQAAARVLKRCNPPKDCRTTTCFK